ncbi:MAG: hypothetical protein Q9169_001756 [Polycauliona sp. 2 TL-2023]
MVRVHDSRAAAAPRPTGALRHAKADLQQKSSYKIILEEMTEKKKKLHTTTSSTGVLSEQVGRVGYHFLNTIVDQACRLLGVKVARSSKTDFERESSRPSTKYNNPNPRAGRARRKHKVSATIDLVEDEMSQKELDAQAISAIRELFPRIPEKDVQQIVTRAFRKGTAKVGTATDQPFIRRVHLAVGAHIRHMYTDYDSLLKEHKLNWLTARAMVQPLTLDKIIEWRDEKDEPDAVEDILREVIVIPDDEEDESEHEQVSARQNSVEVVSSHEYADAVHVHQLVYGASDDETRLNRFTSPEVECAPSVKFIRRLSTAPAERSQRHQDRVDRQHAHRTRVWQEAVNRRKNTAPTTQDFTTSSTYQPPNQRHAPPDSAYSQPAPLEPNTYKPRPGLTESKSLHTNADVQQPSIRAGNQIYATHERLDYGQDLSQVPQGLLDGPATSRFVLPESERLVPSVETEPHVLHRQENLHHVAPGPFDRQFQNDPVGFRNLERDDDPDTPTVKRRRVEDIDWSNRTMSHRVTDTHIHKSALPYGAYRHDGHPRLDSESSGAPRSRACEYDRGFPRRVELVPIIRSSCAAEGDRPQHRDGGDTRGPPHMRGSDVHYEPHVDSPLRQAYSLPQQEASAGPTLWPSIPNSRVSPDAHMRGQPLPYPLHRLPASYLSEAVSRPDYRLLGPGRTVDVESMPMRLRSVHQIDLGPSMLAGGKPTQDRPEWAQYGNGASNAKPSYYGQAFARHSQENLHRMGHHPRQPVALSPDGFYGQRERCYDGSRPGNVPPKLEAMSPRKTGPDHDAVYISSSPLEGAR